MRKWIISLAAALLMAALPASAAAPPDAAASGSYDPATGIVSISLENVSVWQLTATEPFFTGVADLAFFGDFTTDAANEIGALNLAGKWTVTDYEVGPILPADLPPTEQLFLTYGTIQGTSTVDIVIPEPATVSLVALGALAAALRKRRSF